MLVQSRYDSLRCIRQHDHAIAAGALCRHWSAAVVPSFELILGVGIHDIGWMADDVRPTFDAERAAPFDFTTTPIPRRLAIYRNGVDAMERLHPYAGLLGSMHFGGFVAASVAPSFVDFEARRQQRLLDELGADPKRVARDYEVLRVLDLLSLYLCLTGEGSDPSQHPPWLKPRFELDGRTHEIMWIGGEPGESATVRVTGAPFDAEVRLQIPYRDIPARRYEGQADLDAEFDAAASGWLRVRVVN